MVPPPATVAPETSLCPRARPNGTFGWVVRLCLKTLLWFVQIETANKFYGMKAWMGATSVIISNPHSNPQSMMSCTASAYFGSPRGLLSCCKTYPGSIDTVESSAVRVRTGLPYSLRSLFCPILDFQVLQSAERAIVRYQNGFDSQRVSRDHHIQISHGDPADLKGGSQTSVTPCRVGIPWQRI